MTDFTTTLTLPEYGQVWRHHKGTRYTVIALGHDADTGNAVVTYQAFDTTSNPGIWTRRLDVWLGYTEDHKRRYVLVENA